MLKTHTGLHQEYAGSAPTLCLDRLLRHRYKRVGAHQKKGGFPAGESNPVRGCERAES